MKCHETEKKIQKKMIHVCSLFLAHPPLLIFLALWAIFYNDEDDLMNPSHTPGSMCGALGLSRSSLCKLFEVFY